MNKKTTLGLKVISHNRKAHFNYSFKEMYEAGIVLSGSEVKSLRAGKISIAESYAYDYQGEIFLINSNIPSYKESSYNDHDPNRNRKLLLNKKEINKIIGRINREGFSLIPTKIYFKKGKAKIEIGVAKGKKEYDKRHSKKKKDWNREKARIFRKTS
jgi:SsrA-binding protein